MRLEFVGLVGESGSGKSTGDACRASARGAIITGVVLLENAAKERHACAT